MRKIEFEIGKIYHIYNRGANKANIFNDNSDMWRFLQGLFLFNDEKSSQGILHEIERTNKGRINFNLLKEYIDKNEDERDPLIEIIADCLMPNHYHLLVKEIKENGVSQFMHKFGTGYSGYYNRKHSHPGSLFQGPFKAVEIKDDIQLMRILVYINVINPGQLIKPTLKEGGIENTKELEMVLSFAENYSFSTNPDYLGLRDSIIINKEIYKYLFPAVDQYREFTKDTLLSRKYQLINNLALE